MAFKHRKRSPGCRARSGQKEFWQMRSRLTAERNGVANSAPRPMCGRGGVAGVVGTASLQACTASTTRRWTRRIKNGTLVHLPRAGGQIGGFRVSKKRSRSSAHKLSCSVSSNERGRRSPANRREEEVAWTRLSKKKLDERDIDKLTFMEPAVREAQREKFLCLVQEVERKITDLLFEHQKLTKEVTEVAPRKASPQGGLCK